MRGAGASFPPLLLLCFLIITSYTCLSDAQVEDEDFDVTSDASDDAIVEESSSPEEVIKYSTPQLQSDQLSHKLFEHFDDELLFNQRWTKSEATKADSEEHKYDGEWDLIESHVRILGKRLVHE